MDAPFIAPELSGQTRDSQEGIVLPETGPTPTVIPQEVSLDVTRMTGVLWKNTVDELHFILDELSPQYAMIGGHTGQNSTTLPG